MIFKVSKYLLILILTILLALIIYTIKDKHNLDYIYKDIIWSIEEKGINSAKSFDIDNKGNKYIAYSNEIKVITNDNKEISLLKNNDLKISDIVFSDNKLYIATLGKVIECDLKKMSFNTIIENIPNEVKGSKLLVKDDKLFVTIASNTNSGIVSKKEDYHDRASFKWKFTNDVYKKFKTSPFSKYGDVIKMGEQISSNEISNASILSYDLKSKQYITYATGIKSIEGLDFNSEEKLVAIVQGIEYDNLRYIKDDKDYIYTIKEKAWYGWPDYSGGDSVTSIKFSDNKNKVINIIENHPTKVPYGPKYQHKDINSLSALAVENNGHLFEKDTIVFADKKDNVINTLNKNGVLKVIAKLDVNSSIEKIKYFKNSFYVLESKSGYIYKLDKKYLMNFLSIPKTILFFAITFIVIIFSIGIIKIKKIMKKIN